MSRKVSRPQPRRKSSQAPNETRNQKGSCSAVTPHVNSLCVRCENREKDSVTYHRDNGFLDGGGEGEEPKVEGEVELQEDGGNQRVILSPPSFDGACE